MERAASAHWPQLDGLRAVAILAVIWGHASPLPGLGVVTMLSGRAGVLLFFVLSGFLITGILLRHRAAPRGTVLKAFYVRRTLRIVPLYALTLAVVWALAYAPVRDHWVWFATYTTNLAPGVVGIDLGYAAHTWSLAVEEQFYLLFPVLILWLPARWLHRTMLSIIALSVGYRLVGALLQWDWLAIAWPLSGAMDAPVLGALLALYRHEPQRYRTALRHLLRWALLSASLWVILELALSLAPRDTYGVPISVIYPPLHGLLIASVGVGLVYLATCSRLPFLAWRPMQALGRVSYGVYLFQSFLLLVLPRQFGVILLASAALAALSWHLWEAPWNRLKDRFPYPASPRRVRELARD